MKRWFAIGLFAAICAGSATPARAANEEQIRRSITAAVAYLKNQFGGVGGAPAAPGVGAGDGGAYEEGPEALAGIALMEAGVPADDPVIVAITKSIREAATKQFNTYQLALDIIFLDKIGDPVDTHLIQSMGVRLLAGQNVKGGWTYNCPTIDAKEKARLEALIATAGKAKAGGEQVGADIDSRPVLSADVKDILDNPRTRLQNTPGQTDPSVQFDDNSNVQFAILGLWAARRHGLPTERALAAAEQRFRDTQNRQTGGWGYNAGVAIPSTPPMTCAGLLALAIGAGNKGEFILRAGNKPKPADSDKDKDKEKKEDKPVKIPNPLQDRQVQAGLAYVAHFIVPPRQPPPPGGGQGLGSPSLPGAPGMPAGEDYIKDLYFLWSLERVCMVFGLKEIGGKDWYAWGSNWLVGTQNQDGSWRGKYSPRIDTSFGLMFMCRSNIIRDLSGIFNPVLRTKAKNPNLVKEQPPVKPDGASTAPKPNIPADPDAAALAKSLVSATGGKQLELIDKLKSEKGPANTTALALAIPQLTGEMQKRVREALAERIAGFKGTTVNAYLKEEDPELRRAAALAAAMREEMEHVPDLIALLSDSNEIVWRAARLALKSLSGGKDFGPPAGATEDEKKMAIAAWTAWHKERK